MFEPFHRKAIRHRAGFTMLEVLVAIMIIFILAAMAQPLIHGAVRRAKEVELKFKLRGMRLAIDRFKRDWDRDGSKFYGDLCVAFPLSCQAVSSESGYPKRLEDLLDVRFSGGKEDEQERKKQYLRSIPTDPMTGLAEWGLRCYNDDPDAQSWCGDDVFDAHSESNEKAIDGSYYKDW